VSGGRNQDDVVSQALDHFQNHYYELRKLVSDLLVAHAATDGYTITPELDAAIEALRKVVKS
jgi:hypothetical protein